MISQVGESDHNNHSHEISEDIAMKHSAEAFVF